MQQPDLEAIRALKLKATAERNRGRLDRAVQRMDEAIELLNSWLPDPDAPTSQARQLRGELADAWGMKGGLLRRMEGPAKSLEALDAYKSGLAFESKDGTSTYNLMNVIALSIKAGGASPDDPAIRAHLDTASKALAIDTEGSRKDEWWAWADLAQVHLLNGDLGAARQVLAKGKKAAGPGPDERERSAAVLLELAEHTAGTKPAASQALRAAARELGL